MVYLSIYRFLLSLSSLFNSIVSAHFFHFWLQAALYCARMMYASMNQHQNIAMRHEITQLSLVLYPHGIY